MLNENNSQKSKENAAFPQEIVIIIAIASFFLGLVIGVLCSPKGKTKKVKTENFNAREYARSLNFDNVDDEDEGTLAFEL